MKKTIALAIIVGLIAVMAFGVAYAANDAADVHSQACNHASVNAIAIASDASNGESVLSQTDCNGPGV